MERTRDYTSRPVSLAIVWSGEFVASRVAQGKELGELVGIQEISANVMHRHSQGRQCLVTVSTVRDRGGT